MRVRSRLLSSTILALGSSLISGIAGAADQPIIKPGTLGSLPAVSGFNFKLDGFAGTLETGDGFILTGNDPKSIKGARAAFTMPLGHSYGLQIDGGVGEWGSNDFAAGAAHLFWRNPSQGLLGFFASYSRIKAVDALTSKKFGVEGEVYSGRYTVSGIAGWEDNTNLSSRGFVFADIAYYPVDNLKLSIGYRHTSSLDLLALGAEAMAPLGRGAAVSAFVEGRAGSSDYRSAITGLRLYWGPADKSLIRRHREDDPVFTNLPDDLFTKACAKSQFWNGVMCE